MSKRRNRKRTRKARQFANLMIALVLVAGTGYVLMVASRPFQVARRMRADNAQIEQRNRAMEMENDRLAGSVEALRKPSGKEREARFYGYMRPGEVSLVIPK